MPAASASPRSEKTNGRLIDRRAEQALAGELAQRLPGNGGTRVDEMDIGADDVADQFAQQRVVGAAQHDCVGSLVQERL